MNKDKVEKLLDKWNLLLNQGETVSLARTEKRPGGSKDRIRRTTGQPVVFDSTTHSQQRNIQSALCTEVPHLSDLIRSNPEIMDGHPWICKDFIELYFGHFRLVIEKLRRIISQSPDM